LSLYTEKVIKIVEDLVTPILENEGLELVEVEFQREVRGWVLRVFIDKEGGVTLDDCTNVSQQLSAILDVEDPIDTSYTLEVSSPGLTRPLKRTKDYEKAIGRLVKIKTFQKIEGRKRFKGVLLGLKEDGVRLKIDDQILEIPFKDIAKANLEYDF